MPLIKIGDDDEEDDEEEGSFFTWRTGLLSKSIADGLPSSVENAILFPIPESLIWLSVHTASCSFALVMVALM